MAFTEQTNTTNAWKNFQQQERGDVAFDINVAFDYNMPFDGWGDPDIYWQTQADRNTTFTEQ